MHKGGLGRSCIAAVLGSLVLLVLYGDAHGADASAAMTAAGWKEQVHGRWGSRPDRKVVVGDKGLAGEFVIPPGGALSWEKQGPFDLAAGSRLVFEFSSDATNPSSEDYKEFETRFPVSVTVVFGKDSQDIPWKSRAVDLSLKVWKGFPPGGIRIVYAYGNKAPVGSMYRTAEEEAVFILAGEEEKGKTIKAARDLKTDFFAAFGRLPKGPVTGIIVSAERPSKERGKLAGRFGIALPAP